MGSHVNGERYKGSYKNGLKDGHTHGGQFWPFVYPVRWANPYTAGLHNHDGTLIYVNRGTGYWGPPLRLGVESEITLITLDTKKQNSLSS